MGQILHSASAERETPPCTYRFTAPGALGRVWMDGGVASVSHLDRPGYNLKAREEELGCSERSRRAN